MITSIFAMKPIDLVLNGRIGLRASTPVCVYDFMRDRETNASTVNIFALTMLD